MAQLYDAFGNPVSPATVIKNILDESSNPLSGYLADFQMKGVAHRGFSSGAPENTLPAFVLAYLNGFKYVECDVAFTSDNVPVLLHDLTIDRTSDGTGTITSMTFDQVRQYDFGSWFSPEFAGTKIPSLAEFLTLCRNLGLHPYLELKNNTTYSSAQLELVVDMVNGYGMSGSVSYISFNKTYLETVIAKDKCARIGFLVNTVDSSVISIAISLRTGFNNVFLDGEFNSGLSTTIELCKAEGLPFEMWTIDDADFIRRCNDYITGITSNSQNAGFIKYAKALSAQNN